MYTWRWFNAEVYQVIIMIEPKTPLRVESVYFRKRHMKEEEDESLNWKQFKLKWFKSVINKPIGSLSNYDDDHNDDFKKTIGLMIRTTALHLHHAF